MMPCMEDPITTAFTPLIGLPCWGVERGHGSILSFEFGSPHLIVREPYVSNSPSAKLQKQSLRRRVKPVGEWHLFVFCCHWSVTIASELLADDERTAEEIEAATHVLDGQKLTAVTLDPATRATILLFDLGATLKTWPYEANEDEQWSLYLPSGDVLTYRADGMYSLQPGDQTPDQMAWHAGAQSVILR